MQDCRHHTLCILQLEKQASKQEREIENEVLLQEFQKMHDEHPDMGYRRLADKLERDTGKHITDKRALRICRKGCITSKIKWKPKSCTRGDRNPYHIAENVLDRNFEAEAPNQKWCTDISEFKYYKSGNSYEIAGKLYLSAFIDLYDKRIVSFVISDRNDNNIVMKTFDRAVRKEKDAHPLLHSFRQRLPVHQPRIQKAHRRPSYDAKHVSCGKMYRQCSNRRILGTNEGGNVLWQEVHEQRRIAQYNGGLHQVLQH